VLSIKKIIPNVERASPEIVIETHAIQNGVKKNIKLFGVDSDYFEIFNLEVEQGSLLNEYHNENSMPVCVIGEEIRKKFFKNTNPVGNNIKCGIVWLKVIGVLKGKAYLGNSTESLGISNSNEQIYIPSKTMVLRFKNRSLITSNLLQRKNSRSGRSSSGSSGNKTAETSNSNQIDKIIIQVKESEFLEPVSSVVERMLLRKHSAVKDFEIIIPELLLKQQQRTKDIFNIVLGAIASISLIVGGIGIMNIMLASVIERIKEIGTRLAIGATKKDIVMQFLAESTLISIVGGIIGVILGVVFSKLITHFAEIQTIVTLSSVVIAFGISASVGIIFGYMPAKRAAEKDPVESLRHE
jgi:putative ABC transport system permease protein